MSQSFRMSQPYLLFYFAMTNLPLLSWNESCGSADIFQKIPIREQIEFHKTFTAMVPENESTLYLPIDSRVSTNELIEIPSKLINLSESLNIFRLLPNNTAVSDLGLKCWHFDRYYPLVEGLLIMWSCSWWTFHSEWMNKFILILASVYPVRTSVECRTGNSPPN